jgi:2-isopropylmalate synthase
MPFIMAMKVRNDVLPYWTNVDSTMLTRASKLVAAATSFPVQYNKAIVGRNAFAHESGIHQDGMLKHTQTYEIMTPESVGVPTNSLVLGKHSGRHALSLRYNELGYDITASELEAAYMSFTNLADRKKRIYDQDLISLLSSATRARVEKVVGAAA